MLLQNVMSNNIHVTYGAQALNRVAKNVRIFANDNKVVMEKEVFLKLLTM